MASVTPHIVDLLRRMMDTAVIGLSLLAIAS
jgi:hypothetical protein